MFVSISKTTTVMNYTNSFIFRALCSILIGLLLVLNPERMTVALVMIIGILFGISGCYSLINYLIATKSKEVYYKPVFPIVGLGSFLFGIFMAVFPELFIAYLMFVLGIIIMLAGANQIFTFIKFRKVIQTAWYMYVFSLVVLGMGLLILLKPMETASLPFLILGYTSIFYGIAELINGVRIKKAQKVFNKLQKQL
jgi:uncharacterized membrane protein HdeD (DUF308 family)